MLRSIKQLYGNQLAASDGEIGRVKDFYFDDQDWAIRYVVADTGKWLPGRQVLLAPYALGSLDQANRLLRVNLTRQQIEDSPSIDAHKPVSRQYEEEYYRYFGWPYYWQGDHLWGLSGVPILEPPTQPLPKDAAGETGSQAGRAAAHLRSAQAVTGYHLKTDEGIVGHVCDFMMDAGLWAIGQFVVRMGHRLTGHEVLIPTKDVSRISYEESTVFATLPSAAIAAAT
jgi:hypothetical protein